MNLHAGGQFFVLHDETLDRENNKRSALLNMRLEDLHDAVLLRDDATPSDQTLRNDLDLVKALADHPMSAAILQLDIKQRSSALGIEGAKRLTELFERFHSQVIISSPCDDLLRAICDQSEVFKVGIDPTEAILVAIARGQLNSSSQLERLIGERLDFVGRTRVNTIYLNYRLVLEFDRRGIDVAGICHRLECPIDTWTLDEDDVGPSDSLARLLHLKVDQITTNTPDGILTLWNCL